MGLLTGFTTILVVIACGSALAHRGVLDARSQRTLGEIAFFVASPALMVTTISGMHLEGAARNLLASGASLGVCFALYAALARLRWRQGTGEVVIGALAASYVNAGNLGIAIAAYVVGDIAVVVPTLLVQMLVVQPLALVVLDHAAQAGPAGPAGGSGGAGSTRVGGARIVRRLATNPLTLAAVLGLVLAATGWQLPAPVAEPLQLLAGAAIPLQMMPDWFGRLVALVPSAPISALVRLGWLGIDAEGAALSTAEVWTQTTQQTGILLVWLVLGILFVRSHFRWEPRG